jgi:hypothetical protein
MCKFLSKLELLVRDKDRGLTEGQTMHLYECKAVQILSSESPQAISDIKRPYNL